jgi:hypothetical protein
MKPLSPSLLAAQQSASLSPRLELKASNRRYGAVRLDFQRLYNGSEAPYYHAAVMTASGSLLRFRITPPEDGRKLYYQRLANPSSSSAFSQWVYSGQYNAVVVAAAACGGQVSLFWIRSDRRIQRMLSLDDGFTWGAAELVDYTPTTAINGISAACSPSGSLMLFFADQQTLYARRWSAGTWQPRISWDKTTGALSGVAACYDGDWNLVITGRDSAGSYKLWSLVYGDGSSLPAGCWSDLEIIATAPAGGEYIYRQAFMDKADVFRCFYVESFNGQPGYSRPYAIHNVSATAFVQNLWCEAQPFDLSSEYGLVPLHHGACCWLSSAAGVWCASLEPQVVDLAPWITALEQHVTGDSAELKVDLAVDGSLAPPPLDAGCELLFKPGYYTPLGAEVGAGQCFSLVSYEYCNDGSGIVRIRLRAGGGWERLHRWQAREQMRWNMGTAVRNVLQIMAGILARVGLRLEVVSASAEAAAFYPDFGLAPGERGDAALRYLLAMVPDVLAIEGDTAFLINPRPEDAAVYSYGGGHAVMQFSSVSSIRPYNRVLVDNASDILLECFDWEDITLAGESFKRVEDSNMLTVEQASARGDSWLKKAARYAATGSITVAPNCGQQLYDVVEVSGTALASPRMRVAGWKLTYRPDRGEYRQQLMLCGVE